MSITDTTNATDLTVPQHTDEEWEQALAALAARRANRVEAAKAPDGFYNTDSGREGVWEAAGAAMQMINAVYCGLDERPSFDTFARLVGQSIGEYDDEWTA